MILHTYFRFNIQLECKELFIFRIFNIIFLKNVKLTGCGFIGRNLVEHLITNELVSELRVVDKTPPQMAYLNQAHAKIFNNPLVEFYSANLINPRKSVCCYVFIFVYQN